METLSRTPHLKLQEMCDCYLETDFSKQLRAMVSSKSTDVMEDGYKYLALTLLQAITEKAKKLSYKKYDNSITVTIKAVDREIELPSPSLELMDAITTIIRDIIHIEEDKGKSPLILGLKNGQLDLSVKVKRDKKEERLTIKFPELESKSKTSSVRKPMATAEEKSECTLCGYTATGKFSGDICPECGLTYWKCGKCNFTFTAPSPPEKCPGCDEKCDFLNITCYTPECGGPGNIDPRLA
ncbi:MAG: hypothetical protein GQ559_06105 [Desulfobulbaceae bacterium]|nr:hypothetical protein [Desulfobulbaceae bacterium]